MTTPQATDLDGFDELDALLLESKKLAAAKAQAKKSAKLTPEEEELLEADAIAAMLAQWEETEVYAHFITEHCQCGASHRRFNAWYIRSEHRTKPGINRLLKSQDHNGLPASKYESEEQVTYCADCVDNEGLGAVTTAEVSILESIGCCVELAVGQMELSFPEPLAEGPVEALLKELDDEMD